MCTFACTTFAVALAAEQHKQRKQNYHPKSNKTWNNGSIVCALWTSTANNSKLWMNYWYMRWVCFWKSAVSTDKSSQVFYGFHIVSISVIENDEDLVDVCGLQTNKFHEIMQCEEWILIYLVFPKT